MTLDSLYKWLTEGSNAGFTGSVGVGPFKASSSAGFGAAPLVIVPQGAEETEGGTKESFFHPQNYTLFFIIQPTGMNP